jgi:hypothetical protein
MGTGYAKKEMVCCISRNTCMRGRITFIQLVNFVRQERQACYSKTRQAKLIFFVFYVPMIM